MGRRKRISSKTTAGRRRAEWSHGRRNSHVNSDKYWQEQRRGTQEGMISADVPVCCFCSNLVPSIDAHWNDFGDAYCSACGHERGLITYIPRAVTDYADLREVDAFKSDGVDTKQVGFSRFSVSRRSHEEWLRECALIRFERELRQETQKSERRKAAAVAWLGSYQRVLIHEIGRRLALFEKALFWYRRDPQTVDAVEQAVQIAYLGHREGLPVLNAVAIRVHQRSQEPMRWTGMRQLTDAQAEEIRQRYAGGGVSFVALGKQFGVTGATISGIVTNSLYKTAGGPIHVPRPDRDRWAGVRASMGWAGSAH